MAIAVKAKPAPSKKPVAAAAAAPAKGPPAKKPVPPKAAPRPADTRTVKQLLEALRDTEDQGEKRKLRVRLRALGHQGGLGRIAVPSPKSKAILAEREKAKAKAKKAGKTIAEEPEDDENLDEEIDEAMEEDT